MRASRGPSGASMGAPPPTPAWPAGIERRPFDPERHDQAVHAAMDEAFAEEYGFEPEAHDRWRARHVESGSPDPDAWVIAWDGEEIAGCSVGQRYGDGGWIQGLGVRPPWRGRGLGQALLLASFAEFHRRGRMRVELGVDSANSTGATRLYERVGMRERFRFDRYEKTLS